MTDERSFEWDLFISYASEDRESLVRHLAEELSQKGQRVWYDEHALAVGDRLRQRIDDGLARSRFGVVVLSRAFFSKSWPGWELDALVAREEDEGRVILPVWHELTRSDVARYSPLLAGRLAVSSSLGLSVLVARILDAVSANNHGAAADLGTRRDLITGRSFRLGMDNSRLGDFYKDDAV